MSSSAAIRASGLGKSYRIYEHPADRLMELLGRHRRRGRDFWALQGIDLTVQAGEAVGVIGRNGSGKSTLLQLICGLLQPTTGEIAVRGRVAGLLELGAGFNPDFTGRENVNLAATILGLHSEEIAARFSAIEAFAGIGAFIDRPVREYSSGMYARLAFAVCAHVDADLLVIDEILAVGDAAFQQKCMRYLRRFQAGGGTLLFVSHSEAAVLGLCERAVWLDRGQLQADGPSREVCRRYATALQDSGSNFLTGGGAEADAETAPPVAGASAPQAAEDEILDFDPDAAVATGGAEIEAVGFVESDGSPITIAEGGEWLELRIDCVAQAAVQNPIVAFIVRNRIGRAVFSDDTGPSGRVIASGQPFSARFTFYLPHLPTDQYSVEVFIITGPPASARLLAHAVDSYFLTVHSRHVGGGLANVALIEAVLEVETKAKVTANVV